MSGGNSIQIMDKWDGKISSTTRNFWRARFVRVIFILAAVCIIVGCRNNSVPKIEKETPQMSTTQSWLKLSPTKTKSPEATMARFREVDLKPKDTASPQNTPVPISSIELCSPLSEHEIHELPGIISSPYDPPPMGKDDRHQGVDFAYYNQGLRRSIQDEGVQSIAAGWVAGVIEDRLPYGNMIIIETPRSELSDEVTNRLEIGAQESLYHLYAHLRETPLPEFEGWVTCGQLLGYVGKTGYNIPVPHLHLETRIGPSDTTFDGMVFYDTTANPSEMENYKLWRMSGLYRHFNPMLIFDVTVSTHEP
jgi:murein DD-endopeptidase MepM/ murein hydrolase activator NlpD